MLMDVRMPKRSGIDATRAIAEAAPTTRILMLTVSDEEEDLYEAIKAGAAGYLLKEISIEEVAERHPLRGERSEPHHPVDGVEAAGRVHATCSKKAEARQAVPTPAAHRAGSSRCSSSSPRG